MEHDRPVINAGVSALSRALLSTICSFLDARDHFRFSTVSRTFKIAAQTSISWPSRFAFKDHVSDQQLRSLAAYGFRPRSLMFDFDASFEESSEEARTVLRSWRPRRLVLFEEHLQLACALDLSQLRALVLRRGEHTNAAIVSRAHTGCYNSVHTLNVSLDPSQMAVLRDFPALTSLDLSLDPHPYLKGHFAALAALKLQRLHVRNAGFRETPFTHDELKSIGLLPTLTEFAVHKARQLSGGALSIVADQFPSLTALSLDVHHTGPGHIAPLSRLRSVVAVAGREPVGHGVQTRTRQDGAMANRRALRSPARKRSQISRAFAQSYRAAHFNERRVWPRTHCAFAAHAVGSHQLFWFARKLH